MEGIGGDDAYIDPVQVWAPAEASPSGLAAIGVIAQIIVIDLVFSLDSIITAVGMTPHAYQTAVRRERAAELVAQHRLRGNDVPDAYDAAIANAVGRASQTMRNLEWFEVVSTRGHIENGAVAHTQVTVKIGFRMDGAD